jgi:hypothetical protein
VFKKAILAISLLVLIAAPAFADSPIENNAHVHVTHKLVAGNVSETKYVFDPAPQVIMPPCGNLIFRTYVSNSLVIAISWQCAPVQLDPFDLTEGAITQLSKEMHDYLVKTSQYRFVAVFDYKKSEGGSGALYSSSLFPDGFTLKDVKW